MILALSTFFTLTLVAMCGIAIGINVNLPIVKFQNCCKQIPLQGQTVTDMCYYPPKNASADVNADLAANFDKYVGCYGAKKDNRNCCEQAGVVEDGEYAACLDLCNGAEAHSAVNMPDYDICNNATIKNAISNCNQAAYN